MTVEALQEPAVALPLVVKVFRGLKHWGPWEKRVEALLKRYPRWEVAWASLPKGRLLVVEFPLHALPDPSRPPLRRREEYLIRLEESLESSGEEEA